jgi:DNA repair photolyase
LRLAAIQKLTGAGIRCNVLMMPMIPGLTDAPAAIEGVIRAARRAGASGVWWRSLFLKPAAARRFLPFIKENFPADQQRFAKWYSRSAYPPPSYDDSLRPIFDYLKQKYGFHSHSEGGDSAEVEQVSASFDGSTPKNVQLRLINSI